MKKSRLLALLLAMVLVVSGLAACGGDDKKDTTAAPKETEAPKATEAAKETEAPKATEAAKETEAPKETEAAGSGSSFVDEAKMELKEDLIQVGKDVKIALIVKQRSELFYASIESGFMSAVEEAQAMVDYNIEAIFGLHLLIDFSLNCRLPFIVLSMSGNCLLCAD